MKLLFTILASLLSLLSYSQTESPDFITYIKQTVSDSSSQYYYPHLLKRLNSSPSSMTRDDYYFLYYGQTLQKGHNAIMGYMAIPESMDFFRQLQKRDKRTAIKIGCEILKDHPLELTILLNTWLCIKKQNYQDSFFLKSRYELVTAAILRTGDGKSTNTAFKIASIPDENIIKGIVGFVGGKDNLLLSDTLKRIFNVWTNGNKQIFFQEFY